MCCVLPVRSEASFRNSTCACRLVDHVGHTITKATKEGKRLMILCPHGVVRRTEEEIAECVKSGGFTEPAELQSGKPFNKPTDCWVDPKTGDIFISDGYGNSRVHRLKADGTPILSWGTPGTDAGEFQLVHNICGHPDGDKVIVCDRENSRVQVCMLLCRKTRVSGFATFASTIIANDMDYSLLLPDRSLTLRATSFPSLPTTVLCPVLRAKASTLMWSQLPSRAHTLWYSSRVATPAGGSQGELYRT